MYILYSPKCTCQYLVNRSSKVTERFDILSQLELGNEAKLTENAPQIDRTIFKTLN